MATKVSGNFGLSLVNFLIQDLKGLSTIATPINFPQLVSIPFTTGTNAANLTDQFYQASGTLASTATVDIDLYAFGAVTDGAGNAITLAKLKGLIFILDGAATPVEADYVILGNKAATSGWTSFFVANTDSGKIYTGGGIALWSPGAAAYAVGASTTNHLLKLTAGTNSGTVTYRIFAWGTSA